VPQAWSSAGAYERVFLTLAAEGTYTLRWEVPGSGERPPAQSGVQRTRRRNGAPRRAPRGRSPTRAEAGPAQEAAGRYRKDGEELVLVPGHEAFARLGWHDDGCDVTVGGKVYRSRKAKHVILKEGE